MTYQDFLNSKIKLAEKKGFEVPDCALHPMLKPHQRDVVKWAVHGGCRAGFLSFGLGKTIIQLEVLRQIYYASVQPKKMLMVCPLGVKQEFVNDGKKLGISIQYITSTDQITDFQDFYITNYERVRMGSIDPSRFIAVTFDEASILRSLDTETVDAMMKRFTNIPFRFVFTATPAPNKFLELVNYAEYLGIMDRGQSLTRFFQRDSTTAGNLTLYERRKKEFWYWMSSWSCFVTKPSDLGYDNTGYDLPVLNLHHHLVKFEREIKADKKTNQTTFVADASKSLSAAAEEKRISIPHRVAKAKEILDLHVPGEEQWIIWCDRNEEQRQIEEMLSKMRIHFVSLYGSEDIEDREAKVMAWKNKEVDVFLSKPEMYGQGVNMQQCSNMIFVGIDYQFEKFIQAIHRIYRFLQLFVCNVHVIYTDAEDEILKVLEFKWNNHLELQSEMTSIIQEHGLNSDLFKAELGREMFTGRKEFKSENYLAVNNDCVEEVKAIADNSVHLVCTSIPFGNHYEYSENYNCFGHNESNEEFFKQMDFLIPDLYRVLSPGRIAAIHVKDRIRYSYMNGTGFTSIDPFSDDTTRAFRKHGFHLLTRITVTTDVVQENNQTYRLGWSEKCKDGSKMGAGLPEYILVFRKAPTSSDNAYADIPVEHDKKDYTRARWQLDAHAFWKSSGERLSTLEWLRKLDLSTLLEQWKVHESGNTYDYKFHIKICELLDSIGKLPSTFMTLPPQSNNPDVWDDITRMNTLNSDQIRRNLTKHICPLQLDIIERLIESYTNKGETVLDPFAGIMSVPYQALKMDRKAIGIELNTSYWFDGLRYLRSVDVAKAQLSLI